MNRALHRFATLTMVCTFLLLIAGALVTGNDAADSVPDWPLAYHRLIPPMIGGIRFEFTHRVIAGLVATLTLVLAVWISTAKPRQSSGVRRLGWTALALVIAQALLGAARVLEGHAAITATSHAILAQIFFITVVCLAILTGDWWQSDWPVLRDPASPSIHSIAIVNVVIIVAQIVLGAGFRHGAFGIMPHLIGALAVTASVIFVGRSIRIRFPGVQPLRKAVVFLHATFGTQFLLGGAAYWAVAAQAKEPQPVPLLVAITVAHILGGALTLAAAVMLTLRCYRLIPRAHAVGEASAAKARA